MLPRLPLDINTFRALRASNYLYVDKTQYAYNLITGGRRFFLSRPRRFGKSLLVSTLQEILAGNKDLFHDLWIEKSDYPWERHGIISLDLSALGIKDIDSFSRALLHVLTKTARYYAIDDSINLMSPELALHDLVEALHKRFGYVALLIDEYDSPIVNMLHDPERARSIRDALKLFLTAVKGLDAYINFVFITGVSSFTKAGLFSGINNLQIATLEEQFAGICGYTEEEIDIYFTAHITTWIEKEKTTTDALRQNIKSWYNGYHFGKNVPAVYNPFSFMNALHAKDFKNLWVLSGTPTFLIEELKKRYHDASTIFVDPEVLEATEGILQAFDVEAIPLPALLFQTGYLTITGYDTQHKLYSLGYPNKEVCASARLLLSRGRTRTNPPGKESEPVARRTAQRVIDVAEAP